MAHLHAAVPDLPDFLGFAATGLLFPGYPSVNAIQQEEEHMRKLAIALVLIVATAATVFANGNTERLTTIEGTVVLVAEENGRAQVTLRTEAGEEIVVEMPAGEIVRLRLRTETRIRVEGLYIGVPAEQREQLRARILARAVNTDGTNVKVNEPLKLTEQDRLQIHDYERDQVHDQDQDQDQARLQTQARDGK